LHQPGAWLSPGYLCIDQAGVITRVSGAEPPDWQHDEALSLSGYAIPGMANLHSHTFQRAMAGFAEQLSGKAADDSFWTWRESMYRLAACIEPGQLNAIAAQAYLEMLQAGMTSVGEFHYLHGAVGGGRYEDPAELSRAVLTAAREVGIAITHLPVLYLHGGFGQELRPEQGRFDCGGVEGYLALVASLEKELRAESRQRVGQAAHSLRAVEPVELDQLMAASGGRPMHIHIAEQEAEVEDCLAHRSARPVEWLLDHCSVDENWCLVHATHLNEEELRGIASSGAVVGLCPSTEANLGDGIFPLPEFLADGGSWGIGSDSQITISSAEEFRMLEYAQRLSRRRRNLSTSLEGASKGHCGPALFDAALGGGHQALQQNAGSLVPGKSADLLILDGEHPRLQGHGVETLLDAYIFSAGEAALRDVMVAGQFLIRDGQHPRQDEIEGNFAGVMADLAGAMG
jgi:formimidoylglutamate deiminase